MIHLVFGPTGAGKSSYALEISKRVNAVQFTVDQWMKQLFHPDITNSINYHWALERIQRCELQIWSVCKQLLAHNIPVVLEVSMTSREQRRKQLDLARDSGAPYSVYYINTDQKTRRQRVIERNRQNSPSYSFEVTEEMFEFMESLFEPPDESEIPDLILVDNSTEHKHCAACGRLFHCQASDIEHCHCQKTELNQEQRRSLVIRFNGCLCDECLRNPAVIS